MRMGATCQRQGDIVAERGDLGHLDLHPLDLAVAILPLDIAGLQAELGDNRPGIHLYNRDGNAQAEQGLFDDSRLFADIAQAHGRLIVDGQHLLHRRVAMITIN